MDYDKPGIYRIRNTKNDHAYIGSSIKMRNRLRAHRYMLRQGTHPNCHLQAAWVKYGPDSFTTEILEIVPEPQRLIEREQFYIDNLKPEYNLAPKAGSQLGLVHSDEAKAKVGEASRKRGAKPPSRKGTKLTPEQIEQRSETRRKNGWNPNGKTGATTKGRPLTEEHKEKLRQAKLRNPNRYWLGKSGKSHGKHKEYQQ